MGSASSAWATWRAAAVGLRVDRDRGDAERPRAPHDPAGNLAPVRNQEFLHGHRAQVGAFAQGQHGAEHDDAEDDVGARRSGVPSRRPVCPPLLAAARRRRCRGSARARRWRACRRPERRRWPAGRKRWPMLRKETVEKPVISTPASAEQKPLSTVDAERRPVRRERPRAAPPARCCRPRRHVGRRSCGAARRKPRRRKR